MFGSRWFHRLRAQRGRVPAPSFRAVLGRRWALALAAVALSAPAPGRTAPARSLGNAWAGGRSGEATGPAIVASAQRYLGVPYVWGGQGQTGFDCSGLIESVFLAHGYQLPRVSRQQALVGLAVQRPFLPGDLLFFSARPGSDRIVHVALSMGGTRFVHAALGKGEVTYDHLGERYYADRLVGARRPLSLPPGRYTTAAGLAAPGAAVASAGGAAALPMAAAAPAGAAAAAGGAPPAEMVVEHAELPGALARADARDELDHSFADPFGEIAFYPEETGLGLRSGILLTPRARAGLGAVEGRYFGHGSGFRAEVAFPLALQVARPRDELAANAGRVSSVRQWGRLLRLLQLGQADAKLYLRLSRTDAVTLGEGALMRHFAPNAANLQQSDALLVANDATLLVGVSHQNVSLLAMVDDVFAPKATGLSLQAAPRGASGRLGVSAEWASDWRAPYQPGVGGALQRVERQVHGVAAGPSWVLHHSDGARVRAYGLLGVLFGGVRPLNAGVGGHAGLQVRLLNPNRGALGPVFSLRLEARLHSARYRPNYFGFAYAARRQAMPQRVSEVASSLPALNVLAAQAGQPAEVGGLLEVTMALGGRMQLGASYEDGGHFGRRRTGERFVARSLTAFASILQLPLGGTRLLNAHALWHTSERESLWPPVGRGLPGTFIESSARADILPWLDVGTAVRKPLGPRLGWPGISLVADASAHFSF